MRDDVKLIEKTLNGNCEAFGLLVRKYQNVTYALAFQRVGSAVVAEDIAQDVFMTAYRKLIQLKDRGRFGAWLRSICLRQCGMWLRSQKRRPIARPLPTDLTAATPTSQSRGGLPGVDALIRKLPEKLRAAAVLCFEDELSPTTAAVVLGIKPGTLRKRLHDARAQLQRQIVEKTEKELLTHLLPKDFAERCVCRCEKAEEARVRKEKRSMAQKKDCGCGCLRKDEAKPATKAKQKKKKK